MKIQEPQMNSHIKSLFDYVRSKNSWDTRIERGFVQLRDGTFKDIIGENEDEIAEPKDDIVGMMHTHVSPQNETYPDEMYYSNQCFSLKDIHNFISRVFKAIRKEIPKDWDTNPAELDLAKYYTGVVSKHGVYVLTINKKIRNYNELQDLFGAVNKRLSTDERTFEELNEEQLNWIESQIKHTLARTEKREKELEQREKKKELEQREKELLIREEQYILDQLNVLYPSLKEAFGLMFFDLTKDTPEGYSVYDKNPEDGRSWYIKQQINPTVFYNRHECK